MSDRPGPDAPAHAGRGPTRVAVVAGVRLYRDGLADVLAVEDGLDVVAALARAPEDHALLGALAPDVVLLDVTAPDSLADVRRIASAVPGARVIALGLSDREQHVVACAEAGVAGYVTSEQSVEDVVAVVEAVTRGELICSPRIAATLLRHVGQLAAGRDLPAAEGDPPARLTAREREILGLIDRGLSNKQIARQLTIEVATVKNHVHNILEKLHVHRRDEAAARVRSQGLSLGASLHPTLPRI